MRDHLGPRLVKSERDLTKTVEKVRLKYKSCRSRRIEKTKQTKTKQNKQKNNKENRKKSENLANCKKKNKKNILHIRDHKGHPLVNFVRNWTKSVGKVCLKHKAINKIAKNREFGNYKFTKNRKYRESSKKHIS